MNGRILVIAAHPDDVDFGTAASVATWTDAGLEVIYCIVTDGDAGGSDRSVSREDMAVIRRAEQTAAASASASPTCASSGIPTAGWRPRWPCARTWPGSSGRSSRA